MKTLLLLLTLTTLPSVAAQTCYTDTFGNTRCKSDSNVVTEYKPASRNNVVDNSHILGVEYTTSGNSHTNKVDTTGTVRDVDGNKWKTDTIGNTHGVTKDGEKIVCHRDTIGVLRCK